MCGIAGFYNAALPGEEYAPLLRRMMDAMRHRGPDDDGYTLAPELPAGLACCRLSLVDIAGGHQPMANEDDSIQVVVNGEIYNHGELRSELAARGHRFRSVCDSEVIVHLYEEYGLDGLERLEGMFALAVLDLGRRRLLLARDRTGMKSLYWTSTPSGLLFASEIRTLLASGLCSPEADEVAVRTMLAAGFVPAPLTGFRGISKLAPGSWLIAESGATREGRFWQPRFDAGNGTRSEDELAAELRSLLERATISHLRADVPVGLFISGGLDSSLLALLAARHSQQRLKSFSIVFPDDAGADERVYSRAVADAIGSDHHEIPFRMRDLPGLYTEVVRQVEEPSLRSPFALQQLLARRAAGEVKTVISGEGSDELFAGYPWHSDRLFSIGEALHGVVPRPLARVLGRRINGYRMGRMLRVLAAEDRDAIDLLWLRQLFPRPAQGYFDPGLFRLGAERRYLVPSQTTGNSCRDRLQRRLALELIHRLPEGILMPCDKVSMAYSLEVRMPFLDNEVVAFALRLPSRWKIRDETEKYLLKRLDVGLPAEITRRKKFSLRYSGNSEILQITRDWTRELLRNSPDPCPFLLHGDILRAVDAPAGPGVNIYGCWIAITLQSWWNQYFAAPHAAAVE